MTESTSVLPPTLLSRLRDAITDALKYWEPRRIIYNFVLAVIVVAYFAAGWPQSKTTLSVDGSLFLFILAVLANVAYCAAYLGDLFVQFSGFRTFWLRWRWMLFVVGTTFAAAITRFFALGFFSGRS
jgi:hypothetical protein